MEGAIKKAQKRIEDLRREIEDHNYRYYVLDNPMISDQDFDALMRELQDLEDRHPEFVSPILPPRGWAVKPLSVFPRWYIQCLCSLANAFDEGNSGL